jgi:hypothetical protein
MGRLDTTAHPVDFSNNALLKPYRAPHIVLYFLHLILHVAPQLVAIFAVIEIHVTDPEDNGADN